MGSVAEVYHSLHAASTKIEIHVTCENLPNKDIFSKSDPMVVLFIEERNSTRSWKEYGRTEVVKNNPNPRFVIPFRIDYHFEQLQKLKFEVYDSDCGSTKLKKHDYLGHIVISLGSMVGEYCGKVKKTLLGCVHKNAVTSITFLAEELTDSKEFVSLQLKAQHLDKKDTFGQSDPFLIINRQGVDCNEYLPIHRTEVIKGTLNPSWKEFDLSVPSLCNGDRHRQIKVECFDWDAGTHDFIGDCILTLDEMLSNKDFTRELINPKKRDKKNYHNSGMLELCNIEMGIEPSFLDFITGGIELCFHVAIDFTSSNGNPFQEESLHYMSQDVPNQYTKALMAVGKICEDYDNDKLIPAYGFGARILGKVIHDFYLNQTNNPDCRGISGVLGAYQEFLFTADMHGPTNFSPVIDLVTKVAEQQKVLKKYHVLLILTDGEINDMEETKRSIIKASAYPVSIIIVGIGDADFNAMDELDCDKSKLTQDGKVAERDIVQFVPLRNFCGDFSCEDLAKEVLHEVPYQLVLYMKQHGVKPQVNNIEVPTSSSSLSSSVQKLKNINI